MFKKTRRKIIVLIMSSLILLFVLTLSVIMGASYNEVRQRNASLLERYVELHLPIRQPDGQIDWQPPEWQGDAAMQPEGQTEPGFKEDEAFFPGKRRDDRSLEERRDYQLSSFYSVVFDKDQSVRWIDNDNTDIFSEEELIQLASEVLSENKDSGRIGNMLYLIHQEEEYTMVAFMDNTVTENSMSMLLKNILIVGGAAIVVLFFLSLFLSKRIVRPLEENDQQQKQFISNASHELKTPVAVISANSEMLAKEVGENEWLANIQYENERMGELVRQLLDLSRAENKESPMEQVDFSRIVTGEVLAFESLAFEEGKEIQSDLEDGIHLTGNPSQLTQLVSILIDNAVRHAKGQTIEVSLKGQAHAAVLTVVNESEEISQDKLSHLFERFYRLDEARNSEGHHYGLGLSIAKAVAEKHGGTIAAAYEDGKIRFTVTLPKK